jgi:hypothetical protein
MRAVLNRFGLARPAFTKELDAETCSPRRCTSTRSRVAGHVK